MENENSKKFELRSHQIGIKNLLFSSDGKFLISQGCDEEKTLAVWDMEDGTLIKSTVCPVAYNGISLIESDSESKLMFATVGKECYRLWKVDFVKELLFFDVELPESELNLTAVGVTPVLGAPYNCSLVLIGTEDGDVIINNPENVEFLAKVNKVLQRPITLIECRRNGILLADTAGNLIRHSIKETIPLFKEPGDIINFEAPISAVSFDENLIEGHVGTSNNLFNFISFAGIKE